MLKFLILHARIFFFFFASDNSAFIIMRKISRKKNYSINRSSHRFNRNKFSETMREGERAFNRCAEIFGLRFCNIALNDSKGIDS